MKPGEWDLLVERAGKPAFDVAATPGLADSNAALSTALAPAQPPSPAVPAGAMSQPGLPLRTEADVARDLADKRKRQRTAEADARNAGERQAFARALVTRAANTAAAPVTLAARGLRAAGVPGLDTVADLDANEAYADAESLVRDESVSQTRDRHRVTAEANPGSTELGGAAGDALGGAGLEGVAIRGLSSASRMAGRVVNESDVAQEIARKVLGQDIDAKRAARLIGRDKRLGDDYSYQVYRVDARGGKPGVAIRADADDVDAKVERAYYRDGDDLVVEHGDFRLPEDARGQGVAKNMLRQQIKEYDRRGVKRVEMVADDDGRAVWPRMGFELRDPHAFPPIREAFDAHLRASGVDPASVPAANLREIARHPAGPEFLTSPAVGRLDLVADLTGETGEHLRRYLGVSKPGASPRPKTSREFDGSEGPAGAGSAARAPREDSREKERRYLADRAAR